MPQRLHATIGLASGHWQFETANAHFTELFQRALEVPQIVRRGDQGMILIQSDHFCRFVARSYAPAELVELLEAYDLEGISHYEIGVEHYEISRRAVANK
jgi:hypothetical protein